MKKLTDQVTFRHGATITSRTAQSPMLTGTGINEMVSDDTLAYYGARSQSAGMVIVEYTNVSLNGGPSRSYPDHEQLAIYDDKFIPGLKKVATALKKDGNKAILQICHAGREANYAQALGRCAVVPSMVEMPWIDYPLHVLEEDEVWDIVKDFGAATKRAIECGFDGIEIHGANHYLIQEFFSDFSNKRSDYWGGTLEKRMNFAMEVAKEVFRVVKEHAPKDFIVGYRISPDEIHGSNIGYTWHESTQLVKKLTETFDFDYLHISLLQYDAKPEDSDLTFCELLKQVLAKDTMLLVAGAINTYEKMQDALRYVDIIAMGRATLIDPQIKDPPRQGEISSQYDSPSRLPCPGVRSRDMNVIAFNSNDLLEDDPKVLVLRCPAAKCAWNIFPTHPSWPNSDICPSSSNIFIPHLPHDADLFHK